MTPSCRLHDSAATQGLLGKLRSGSHLWTTGLLVGVVAHFPIETVGLHDGPVCARAWWTHGQRKRQRHPHPQYDRSDDEGKHRGPKSQRRGPKPAKISKASWEREHLN